MHYSVFASILASLATTTLGQYTVLELAPISPIPPPPPPPPRPTMIPTSKIATIATITVAPIPYSPPPPPPPPPPNSSLTTSTHPTNTTTSCGQTLCIDYINTCGIMYGGCFPHCSGMTTPSFTNPGCPSNRYYPGKTPEASMTTATCGYKCDNFVDGCGQTYGPGCYTSCEGFPTPGWTTPFCGVVASFTEGGIRGVETALLETGTGIGTETG